MSHSDGAAASPRIKSVMSADASPMHAESAVAPPAPAAARGPAVPLRVDVSPGQQQSSSVSTPDNDTGARVHAMRPTHLSDLANLAKVRLTGSRVWGQGLGWRGDGDAGRG